MPKATKAIREARKQKNKLKCAVRENIRAISKGAIRRLARRAGVRRIGSNVYSDIRNATEDFVTRVVNDSIVYAEHANRKTITALDVLHALRRRGRTLYGY